MAIDIILATRFEHFYVLRESGLTIDKCLERAELTREQMKRYRLAYTKRKAEEPAPFIAAMPSPKVCFSEMIAALQNRPYIRMRIMNQVAVDNMPQPTEIILDEVRL